MSRRRKRLIWSGCVALLFGAALLLWREREPRYQGRPLSTWLGEFEWNSERGLPCEPATEAVRQIGTNALPFLMRWYSYEPAPWREKLSAAEALGEFGAAARSAIPALARMQAERDLADKYTAERAIAGIASKLNTNSTPR